MEKKINPGILGLLGFGLATVLLNLHNVGLLERTCVTISMGLMLGGFAQLIAGILEFKNKNTFGGTAFVAYGMFWLSLVYIWEDPTGADKVSMGYYLLLWGIFTLVMFICTFKHNINSRFTFGLLTLLFILLAIGDFTHSEPVTIAAGVVGLLTGLSALYGSFGQIINDQFDKNIIPL